MILNIEPGFGSLVPQANQSHDIMQLQLMLQLKRRLTLRTYEGLAIGPIYEQRILRIGNVSAELAARQVEVQQGAGMKKKLV